jgi:general secretion pathway protein E/type IV pilus assembly protein PilB
VRTICPDCKEPYEPDRSQLPDDFDLPADRPLHRGAGCRKCRGTGFRGRAGIFELMNADDEIRDAVMRRASSAEIGRVARANGMRTLRADGWQKVRDGMTTIEEVLRSTKL